jgi:hypothetical protein
MQAEACCCLQCSQLVLTVRHGLWACLHLVPCRRCLSAPFGLPSHVRGTTNGVGRLVTALDLEVLHATIVDVGVVMWGCCLALATSRLSARHVALRLLLFCLLISQTPINRVFSFSSPCQALSHAAAPSVWVLLSGTLQEQGGLVPLMHGAVPCCASANMRHNSLATSSWCHCPIQSHLWGTNSCCVCTFFSKRHCCSCVWEAGASVTP